MSISMQLNWKIWVFISILLLLLSFVAGTLPQLFLWYKQYQEKKRRTLGKFLFLCFCFCNIVLHFPAISPFCIYFFIKYRDFKIENYLRLFWIDSKTILRDSLMRKQRESTRNVNEFLLKWLQFYFVVIVRNVA